MRIRISEPALLPGLIDFLRRRGDFVVEQVGDELELWVVGSYAVEAQRMAIELQLRAWQAAHPEIELELEPRS
jgi:hypothetical protein